MYLSKLQFEIVQVILCQIDSIFHQLIQNLTRDCRDILSELYKAYIVFLLISNLISWLRLHQFLGTKTTEANKSLKTDENGAN